MHGLAVLAAVALSSPLGVARRPSRSPSRGTASRYRRRSAVHWRLFHGHAWRSRRTDHDLVYVGQVNKAPGCWCATWINSTPRRCRGRTSATTRSSHPMDRGWGSRQGVWRVASLGGGPPITIADSGTRRFGGLMGVGRLLVLRRQPRRQRAGACAGRWWCAGGRDDDRHDAGRRSALVARGASRRTGRRVLGATWGA